MNLSEVLIGNNMGAHPDCLGIYIGIDEIYVAQSTKREGGGVALESLIRVPVNIADKSRLKPLDLNETYFTMDNWLDALGKVTAKKTWSTSKVVVSLSPEFCLLRHFIISIPLKRKEWAEGIPNEARKYIHFTFNKAVYSYHVYEFETAATKQKRLGVVFAMTTQTIIERLKKGLKSLGLDLISVEPDCLSLGRVFSDNDKEAIGKSGRIYSFFGKDKASFVFLNGVDPILGREVEISGSLPAERRRFEITNSTEFIAKQLERDPFEEAVIMGYNTDQWRAALEADARKPVRAWDLKEVFGIETKSVGEMAAIGASGKFFNQRVPDIDFTKGNRLSAREFNASWTMWKIVLFALVVLLLLLAKSYVSVLLANYQLKKKEAVTSNVLEDFKGLTATELSNNLNNIKAQNETLSDIYGNTPLTTPILVAIANSVQQNMWLTRITYSSTFPSTHKGGGSLEISGSIASGKESGEDLIIGGRFKEALAQQRELAGLCRNANIRYSQGSSSSGGKRARTTAAETKFTLSCVDAAKEYY